MADPLERFLARHAVIGFDTSVLIYALEGAERYRALVQPILIWLDRGGGRAAISTITMVELLVHPYKAHDDERANTLYALATAPRNVEWVSLTLEIADRAARVRAETNLKAPDSIQAATALLRGATGFVCNDAAFRRIQGLEILVLDDLLAGR